MSLVLGGLAVTIQTDANHPDAVDDLANRARATFHEVLDHAIGSGIDPMQMQIVEEIDTDED